MTRKDLNGANSTGTEAHFTGVAALLTPGVMRALTAATVAVGTNALSVMAQARGRAWERACGEHALACHAAAIAPAWTWFLLEQQRIERPRTNPQGGWLSILGGTLTIIGNCLLVAGFRRVGPGALVNADLFSDYPREWQSGGVYAPVADPISLGYGLALAGRAVRLRSGGTLVVAAWLSALLLAVEAPVERWAHPRARSSSHVRS